MNKRVIYGFLIILVISIGILQLNIKIRHPQSQADTQKLIDVCIKECRDSIEKNEKLESGPCLLDPIKENSKWVCDIAHSPREQTDNLPENQCQAFRNGIAQHFIEISPDCRLIKVS
jgi:hypothetical protein